jgi:hypothetical protein
MISVTRALTEKKNLKDRIAKAIEGGTYHGYVIGDKRSSTSPVHKTEEDIKSAVQSSNDKINGLIDRYNLVTSSIIKSNAETEVEIGGKKMTVAEAIEKKASIEFMKLKRDAVSRNLAIMLRKIENNEAHIKKSIDQLVQANLSSEKEPQPNVIETISKSINGERKLYAVDPINLQKTLEELNDEIDTFEAEVDFVLSESNAITMLEI